MSQFLICKSKDDLSIFGIPYVKCDYNMPLYNLVIQMYLSGNTKDVWIIEAMGDWICDIKHGLSQIEFLAEKSDAMIFWYGNEFDELDKVHSIEELIDYIKHEAYDPSLELYLFYERKVK